ncbi:hypothetical protein F4777DRAFT_300011 [Nemania sp. FL0916]|nr:hypothetical protein F4777DRAFT_300011 [Nemania sp. FL0916]
MGSEQFPTEKPPPYASLDSGSALNSDSPGENYWASQVQHHLASLPSQIRALEQKDELHQRDGDSFCLNIIRPLVAQFLQSIPERRRPGAKRAHLFIVPETAVPQDATLSGMEEMEKQGELCVIVRAREDSSGSSEKSTSAATTSITHRDSEPRAGTSQEWTVGREFSDWGRFGESTTTSTAEQQPRTWWWKDEMMAIRLASRLIPSGEELSPANLEKNPLPKMMAVADEVCFRSENAFGIIESLRGWAIWVTVRI